MAHSLKLKTTIIKTQCGYRLDKSLALLFPNTSRTSIKNWIINNNVKVNGKIINKPKKKFLDGKR